MHAHSLTPSFPALTAGSANEFKTVIFANGVLLQFHLALYQLCPPARQRVKTQPHTDDLFKALRQ